MVRVTRKPLAGKKYLLSKKVISKASLTIAEVICLAKFNINFNAYF